jgi:mannosyl-oligosaccharide glucosidase
MKVLQLLLVVVGFVSSIICFYYVGRSLYRHILPVSSFSNSVTSPVDVPASTSSSSISKSKPDVYNWKLSPDLSLERLNSLPSWGSYRPGYYFGLKSTKTSLSTGIMWLDKNHQRMRHKTQQDEVQQFDWIEHDGVNYGKQVINDIKGSDAVIETSFVVPTAETSTLLPSLNSYTWIQKVSISFVETLPSVTERTPGGTASLTDFPFFFYLGSGCYRSEANCLSLSSFRNIRILSSNRDNLADNHVLFHLVGQNDANEVISLRVMVSSPDSIDSFSYFVSSEKDAISGSQHIQSEVLSPTSFSSSSASSRHTKGNSWFDDFGELKNKVENEQNGVKFLVLRLKVKSSVDIYYTLQENLPTEYMKRVIDQTQHAGTIFTGTLNIYSELKSKYFSAFLQRLKRLEKPLENKDTELPDQLNEGGHSQIKTALSSLLGGIGYFEGESRVEWNVDKSFDTIHSDLKAKSPSLQSPHQEDRTSTSRTFTKLLTATPSRTVFPRGFLWDEGFHQMVISHWNFNITMKVLSDWLNAMYVTDYWEGNSTSSITRIGWIPREMILDDDSKARVPDEFISQRLNIANPPTFLLVIEKLLNGYESSQKCEEEGNSVDQTCVNPSLQENSLQFFEKQRLLLFFEKIFPRLHYWIQWFRITQESSFHATTFRWRGRSNYDNKVIPNTLSSGLDDYPRGIFPISTERHVDLLCWMIKSYQIMNKLEQLLVKENRSFYDNLRQHHQIELKKDDYHHQSEVLLNSLYEHHYSSEYKGFFDFGINNESAVFLPEILFRCFNPETKDTIDGYIPVFYLQQARQQQQPPDFCPSSHPQPLYPVGNGDGGYVTRERLTAQNFSMTVVPRVGYVTLFPFLLKVLRVNSTKEIQEILTIMEDPELLYTDYGIRSIATTDKFYLKRNSPGDAPYWRFVLFDFFFHCLSLFLSFFLS